MIDVFGFIYEDTLQFLLGMFFTFMFAGAIFSAIRLVVFRSNKSKHDF